MEKFEKLVKNLLLNHGQSSTVEFTKWLEECDECLNSLNKYLNVKSGVLSIGAKQKIIRWIANLKRHRVLKRIELSRSGQGHSGSSSNQTQTESLSQIISEDIETCFKGRISTRIFINLSHIEPNRFFEDAKKPVIDYVIEKVNEYSSLKINSSFSAEFVSGDKSDVKSFNTPNFELFRYTDLSEWYEKKVYTKILTTMEEFQERDSGWALSKILHLMINVNKYNPLRVGCYNVKIPKQILLKRATINVKTEHNDSSCFFWSVVACLYKAKNNVDRQSSYPHYSQVFSTEGIKLPMTLNQIKKFEKLNDISINVFYIEDEEKNKSKIVFLPLICTSQKRKRHANILLLQNHEDIDEDDYDEDDYDDDEDDDYDDNDEDNDKDSDDDHNYRSHCHHHQHHRETTSHFVAIRSLSRLLSSQLSKNKQKKYICDR